MYLITAHISSLFLLEYGHINIHTTALKNSADNYNPPFQTWVHKWFYVPKVLQKWDKEGWILWGGCIRHLDQGESTQSLERGPQNGDENKTRYSGDQLPPPHSFSTGQLIQRWAKQSSGPRLCRCGHWLLSWGLSFPACCSPFPPWASVQLQFFLSLLNDPFHMVFFPLFFSGTEEAFEFSAAKWRNKRMVWGEWKNKKHGLFCRT